jgi:hypothetical protein
MYRDDLAATHARLDSLQRDLDEAQAQGVRDQRRITTLQSQLQVLQQTVVRLGGSPPQQQIIHASRGNLILALGILAIILCSLLGPIAWALGNDELRRIRLGHTPPTDATAAAAGRVCGIVGTAILFLVMLMLIVFLASRPDQGF